MGLTYSYTSSFAHHPKAFFNVSAYDYRPGREPTNVVASGSVYMDEGAYKLSKNPVGQFNYTFIFEPNTKSTIISQGDEALKELIVGKSKVGGFNTGSLVTLLENNPDFRQGDNLIEEFERKSNF